MSIALTEMDRSGAQTKSRKLEPLLLVLWLLMLVTFSAPGRTGQIAVGSLDVIALAKLAVRAIGFGVLGLTLVSSSPTYRRQPLQALTPWFLFVGWAFVTVLWSPLKSISIGQAGSLLVLVMLACSLAILVRDVESLSYAMKHLCWGLFTVSTIIVAVRFAAPEQSGLLRGPDALHSGGIVHPTSAGATASLGLLLVVTTRLFWNWGWTQSLLIPGATVHTILLFVSQSRTALGMTALVLALIFLVWIPSWAARLALMGSILGAVWLFLDPTMTRTEEGLGTTFGFLSRGESLELLLSLTGRTDLWEAVWASYYESPIVGHGYFVTAPQGLLDVWGEPANRTAHNILLQVLVSTGIIGLGLFLWGCGRLLGTVASGLVGTEKKPLRNCLGVIALWYLGWSQLCVSFMGPIQPEAVTFFALAGLGLAGCWLKQEASAETT